MIENNPVECSLQGTELRASDGAGNAVVFDLTGWDRLPEPHEFDEPIDAALVGYVTEVRYDLRNVAGIDRLDGDLRDVNADARSSYGDCDISAFDDVRLTLPEGQYRWVIDTSVLVRLRFDGSATVRNRPDGDLTISFPYPTPVTFGFTSTVDYPTHELTVEPTTAGFATAITHLGATIQTTSPDRANRNYRDHPPLVELGDETRVPDAVREMTPDTGIELAVPDRWEPLFPAAPLAYYLGAAVRVEDVPAPVLRAPAVDLRHEFSPLPAFQVEAGELLRRAFFLDEMALWLGPEDPTLHEHERLKAVGIDIGGCGDASLAERVKRYLDLPATAVDDVLPEWPSRVTVAPTASSVPAVPYLLSDLSAIVLPRERGSRGPNARTGDDAAEADAALERWTACAPVEAADGLRGAKRLHGVLGGEATGSCYTALLDAYENRLSYLGRHRNELTVAVVFADGGASDEADGGATAADDAREEIVASYARRDENVPISVERIDEPTCRELASVIEEGVDFLHYVGDCDGSGLACRDGYLRPAELPGNDTQLFQLDAPRSRAVGVGLVETGSVAGVVHDGEVSTAGETIEATVGELTLYGMSIATAQVCARISGDIGPTSRVVGDGTHRFVAKWQSCAVGEMTADADGVRNTVVTFQVDPVGTHYGPDRDGDKWLMPSSISYEVDGEELTEFLPECSYPIFYDGRFHWMEAHPQLVYPLV